MMLKKMRVLISAQHALMLAYRAEIYLWVIAMILPFIMMSIWTKAAASPSANQFAMTPLQYAHYFFAVWVIRQFTAVWMIYDFEYQVNEGKLSTLLLRPMHAIWSFVAAHLGEQLARFPFFFVVAVLFFILYPQALWLPSTTAIILGILAIYTAFALRFALQFALATLTFWFERASALDQLTWIPYLFLSGFIIPLKDMPKPVADFANFTPFPYLINFPASIITGDLTLSDPALLAGFAITVLWFLALSALGQLLWKRGLLQYSGQGA